jgi:hypothetical protein
MSTTVKLSTIVAGHRFMWCGVLFEATHETTEFEGRLHRRVIYRSASGTGQFQPGDKGLMPVDEEVYPCRGMTSEVVA